MQQKNVQSADRKEENEKERENDNRANKRRGYKSGYELWQVCCVKGVVIMAKNSRAKGASGERELANLLKEHGYTARRGQQYCGANGDADVVGLDGIHIECKRVERLNIDEAMAQAVADAREGEKPAIFHRKNRKGWLVTMRLEDWLKMYKSEV